MIDYAEARQRLQDHRAKIEALHEEMRQLTADTRPEPVEDYEFQTPEGSRRLSDLFGGKRDLLVIHNMGKSCPACTMWADGFNGVYDHLASRAAFAVSSPDAPDVQRAFAAGRGWRFPMVSHAETTFARDMGYLWDEGYGPGVSAFRKDGDRVVRIADAELGPGDDFCVAWRLFDLLDGGMADFRPQFRYA